jgi:hypothetical protein
VPHLRDSFIVANRGRRQLAGGVSFGGFIVRDPLLLYPCIFKLSSFPQAGGPAVVFHFSLSFLALTKIFCIFGPKIACQVLKRPKPRHTNHIAVACFPPSIRYN